MSGTKFGFIEGIFAAAALCFENAADNVAEVARQKACVKEQTKAIAGIKAEQKKRSEEIRLQEFALWQQIQEAETVKCSAMRSALKTRCSMLLKRNLNTDQTKALEEVVGEIRASEKADVLIQYTLLVSILKWLQRFESVLNRPDSELDRLVQELKRIRGHREAPERFKDSGIEADSMKQAYRTYKQILKALLPALRCVSLDNTEYFDILGKTRSILKNCVPDKQKPDELAGILDRVLGEADRMMKDIGSANSARTQFENELVVLKTVYTLLGRAVPDIKFNVKEDPVLQLEKLRKLKSEAVRKLRDDPLQIRKRNRMVKQAAFRLKKAMKRLGLSLAGTEVLKSDILHSVFSDKEGLGYNTYISPSGAISMEVVGVGDDSHELTEEEKKKILERSRECDSRRDEILKALEDEGIHMVIKDEPKATLDTVRRVAPPVNKPAPKGITADDQKFFEQELR